MSARLILWLSRADLVAAGACNDGLALFDALKVGQDEARASVGRTPRRSLRVRYDLLAQLWMATAYPSFFGWLGDVGLLPRVHAVRANLDGANLVRANLVRANLVRANLVRASLVGANLDGANLVRANLDGANLDGANLDGASLVGASLVGASLDGANLVRANLDGANLVGARHWPLDIAMPKGFRLCDLGCCIRRADEAHAGRTP